MTEFEQFRQRFANGLRSVPGYVDTLCERCRVPCGEPPDDQCLISAWADYVAAAHKARRDAFEIGRQCASLAVDLRRRAAADKASEDSFCLCDQEPQTRLAPMLGGDA